VFLALKLKGTADFKITLISNRVFMHRVRTLWEASLCIGKLYLGGFRWIEATILVTMKQDFNVAKVMPDLVMSYLWSKNPLLKECFVLH